MKRRHHTILFLTFLVLLASCAPRVTVRRPVYNYSKMNKITRKAHKRVEKFLDFVQRTGVPFRLPKDVRIDSVVVHKRQKDMRIYFNKRFSFVPFREKTVQETYALLHKFLGWSFRKYRVTAYSMEVPLRELVPNYFRPDTSRYDRSRMPRLPERRGNPLIFNASKNLRPSKGLFNRYIVVWPSHGWYYNLIKHRWEWQRARLFETVEDLHPASFVLPFLLPMLENAGATVLLPRERDLQMHEVIVDNDSSSAGTYREISAENGPAWRPAPRPGFAIGHPPYPNHLNPFLQGTARIIPADSAGAARAEWIPDIPETGTYWVSIAYPSLPNSAPDAEYVVYHAGGRTRFRVNQRMGGETWIYLGTFRFRKGVHPDSGKVVLLSRSSVPAGVIGADAVRFGGGMGVIQREGQTSGRPKFEEGARYYLQFAGMPDTLVYSINADTSDYKDDYQCRGEYVDYLRGRPFGPNRNRSAEGLHIPVDISLAFHTDAGISRSDTTIGTLAIYSIIDAETTRVFPDSVSRLANRDLSDLIQTQLVRDLRAKWDPIWNRRELREAQYSEAFRPNVPAMLLELLSHQNFTDMRFALDPRFRFDVARAIYKGMLRFLATQYRREYVVEPLPVTHFRAEFTPGGTVRLSWRPQPDPLEPTAMPTSYRLYTRVEDGGFDNGRPVDSTAVTLTDLKPGVIYSFRVTAVNDGGESFPSEILAVCRMENANPTVLIVNGFDRICGPAAVSTGGFAGMMNRLDEGVPYLYDFYTTGEQYDFDPDSPFRTNDGPGWGSSGSELETTVFAGNTFDYPFVHGRSLRAAGYSFVSASKAAVLDGQVDLQRYRLVDLILGEEKTTHWQRPEIDSLRGPAFVVFPKPLQEKLTAYLQNGGRLFVSGAYVGTDLFRRKPKEDPDVQFGREVLHIQWMADHAAKLGRVHSVADDVFPAGTEFNFNTAYSRKIYRVESPDAIDPVGGAQTILRYSENEFSAGVAYAGAYRTVVLGFPFETVLGRKARNRLMADVLRFLMK